MSDLMMNVHTHALLVTLRIHVVWQTRMSELMMTVHTSVTDDAT